MASIDGSMWLTLSSLYNGASSSVKWLSLVSDPFIVRQGVRQDGILSTLHYKLFNNYCLCWKACSWALSLDISIAVRQLVQTTLPFWDFVSGISRSSFTLCGTIRAENGI